MVANFDDTTKKPPYNEGEQNNAAADTAVALKYEKGRHEAPHVAAKGKGRLAERILELAAEHDIPIRSDADLVEVLDKVEVDEEIPLEVYAVVAEIFAYIYRANEQRTPE